MQSPFRVCEKVYMVGSADISSGMDCCVYLVDAGELVLIDAGAGGSTDKLIVNIQALGFMPEQLTTLIITHAHIDHIGSAADLRDRFNLRVIAHAEDSAAIESGKKVGAEHYGVRYRPCPVDEKLAGQLNERFIGSTKFSFMYVPGHTPGSMVVTIESEGKKVLFGQDIHGPYMPMWGGDPQLAAISLERIMQIEADILCEGHYGAIKPADEVKQFISEFLDELKS
ncbi:MAG: MBL fold metallo-hydrolase [Dehalococcoidia bacterium]|nr:MBL fold metallo-hydrolase [Dehalococcoidia bacterium]